jgi:hypothetical protein
MQKEADKLEGPRYYLPRPWLHLKQRIPVASRVAFVSLRYSAQTKRYELSVPLEAESWVKQLLPNDVAISAAVAKKLVTGSQQAGTAGGTEQNPKPPAGGGPQSGVIPPTTVVGKVGFINDEDPVTELSSLLDVVYLPDFDEQFVIQRSWGLGRGSLEVELRNGWAAEVFGEEVDRSNLVPYVIDQVESAADAALDIAKKVAQVSTGLPVGEFPLVSDIGSQQSGATGVTEQAAFDLLGNLVLLKVVEIRIAQPGLYPILKPREIVDWFGMNVGQPVVVPGADVKKRFEQFLSPRGLPWIRPDQVFVPAPPLTMIAFNTTTDAYVGAVTKGELGFGAYVMEGAGESGSDGSDAKRREKIIEKLVSAVEYLTGDAAAAAAKLNFNAPKVEEDKDPSKTKITLTKKSAAPDLTTSELDDAVRTRWMVGAFGLSEEESGALRVTAEPGKVVVSGLPAMSRLAGI